MTNRLQPHLPALPHTREVTTVPHIDEAFLRVVRDSGFQRMGIVAALVEGGKIMMLRHRKSDKSDEGTWGPLAETSKATRVAGVWHPEDPIRTLRRAIDEEVGLQIGFPPLRARAIGGFTMATWPIGIDYPGQNAYAIVPVLHMERGSTQRLVETFTPTEEIDKVAMLSPDQIRTQCLRPGVLSWLHVVEHSPLFAGQGPFVELQVPGTMPRGEQVDIIFSNMEL